MSTDYFLVSRSRKRAAMIGSDGFSGVQSFPGHPDVVAFIRWAIEEGIKDIGFMSEHELDAIGFEEEELR